MPNFGKSVSSYKVFCAVWVSNWPYKSFLFLLTSNWRVHHTVCVFLSIKGQIRRRKIQLVNVKEERRRSERVSEWVIVCYSGPQRFCVCQILWLYIVMQPDKYFTPAVNTAQNQSSVFWEGTKQKVSAAAAACVYLKGNQIPFISQRECEV